METVKIENTEFIRDMSNKAVLNTDVVGLRSYKQTRQRLLMSKQEAIDTRNRLELIEREMLDLKGIISELAVLRSVVPCP